MTDRVAPAACDGCWRFSWWLVQVNTSHPPGNEAQVAELLAPRLRALGFEVEIVQTPTAGKAHLIARLPGTAVAAQ